METRATAEKEEARLVREVLAENPPETKGERDEWKLQTGIHRKEDIFATGKEEAMWTKIERLFHLGVKDPAELVKQLEFHDPFGTAKPETFVCPMEKEHRVDSMPGKKYPFYENASTAAFKRGDKDAFIFYQHLRKAGGTGFCDLAKKNMKRGEIPAYYCMPDRKGSLSTPPWNNAHYLQQQLLEKGHRIASNEWDAWNAKNHNKLALPKAAFVTTFRHPLDRWYSQYRFEHLEHRDGSGEGDPRLSFMDYYDRQKDWTEGLNYYVTTFDGTSDERDESKRGGDFYWTYHKYQKLMKQQLQGTVKGGLPFSFFKNSLVNLQSTFDLLLVLEYMDMPSHFSMIKKKLGWIVPPVKTLPHETQARREVSKDTGKTVSVTAKEAIPTKDYERLARENVFDLLMYAVVRRMVLERMTCIDAV